MRDQDMGHRLDSGNTAGNGEGVKGEVSPFHPISLCGFSEVPKSIMSDWLFILYDEKEQYLIPLMLDVMEALTMNSLWGMLEHQIIEEG